ncbi:FMN-dependent NADH-azoreductase [Jannaschia sp. 2305UL9-9]|uniref:FMN-dependent NADH-azoreductase n=1 Tax=Jannaschia sp. 2305UL9-9 TaxID=3121638 RepID=UPI003529AAB4
MTKILRIDSSARTKGSVTRDLTDRIVTHLGGDVTIRDLAQDPLPQLTEDWVAANFTPAGDRTAEQVQTLALSDALIAEVEAADTLVIGLPIYNFGAPAALKAWVDLIARAGVTFKYTPDGPVGLLTGKRAIVAMASGGVPMGAPVDFATGFIKQVLAFVGITDVTFVAADQHVARGDDALKAANAQIATLAA